MARGKGVRLLGREEREEGKGFGERDWGLTGWWSICALKTEYSMYFLVIVEVGNEKGICSLSFVST